MRTSTITSIALCLSLVAGLAPASVVGQEAAAPTSTLTERLAAAIARHADSLGGDPAGSREYVAARVGYEDYDGVLKGAPGTYLAGTANGADQALLLAALIDPSVETRFAVCTPDGDLANELSAQAAETDAGRGLALDRLDEIEGLVEDPELSAGVAEILELRSSLKSEASQAADHLSNDLYDAGYERVDAPTVGASAHVWLQAMVDGEWVDLDTTSADGSARCEVEATHDTLDEKFEHVIRFIVSAEERTDGALETSELLQARYRTADLATSRISLLFGEPAGLLEVAAPTGDLASYTPILRIDGETLAAGDSIELPRPAAGIAGAVDDTLGGVTGLFDSLPGGTEEQDEADGSEGAEEADAGDGSEGSEEADAGDGLFGGGDEGGLFGEIGLPGTDEGPEPTAMWLEIELLTPNGETITTRTELFDRIGIAARAGGEAASVGLAALEEIGGEYAPMSTLWQIGLLTGGVTAAEGAALEPIDTTSIDSYAAQLDAQLRSFPAIHRDMGGDGVVPALLVASLGPGLDAAGQPVTRLAFDALHAPSRAPVDERAAAVDAHAVLAAERMLAAVAGHDDGTAADSGAVFRQTWDDGTRLVRLAPGEATGAVSASPEALARIHERLDAGYSLLVPEAPASIDGVQATAWWTIDPATGIVRDEHESGGHQDTTEYAVKTEQTLTTMERFRRFGCRIARPAATVALVLFIGTTASPISPLFEPLSEVVEAARVAREAEAQRKAAEDAACRL